MLWAGSEVVNDPPETVTVPAPAMFWLFDVRFTFIVVTPVMFWSVNVWLTDDPPVLIATITNPLLRYAVT